MKRTILFLAMIVICLLCLVSVAPAADGPTAERTLLGPIVIGIIGLSLAFGLSMAAPNLRDASLKVTRALPSSGSAVTSDPIDTGKSMQGDQRPLEFLVTAPALSNARLATPETMKYSIVGSTGADLSTNSDIIPLLITQTGAGNAGAAATSARFVLPSDAPKLIGLKITPSASADASGVSATLEAVV